MRIILVIFFGFFIFSSFLFKKKDHCYIAHSITNKIAPILASKYKMEWNGTGGGMMGGVNMLSISFDIFRPLEKNEARKILVDCVEIYLKAINENEEIRPHLKNYPFIVNNIELSISSYYPNHDRTYEPYVSVISTFRDEIKFKYWDPNNENIFKRKESEPYQKALEIVRKEMPNVGQIAEKEIPKKSWLRSCVDYFTEGRPFGSS